MIQDGLIVDTLGKQWVSKFHESTFHRTPDSPVRTAPSSPASSSSPEAQVDRRKMNIAPLKMYYNPKC